MSPIFGVIIIVLWLYLLRIFHKSELWAWKYIWGSCGLFIFMMIYLRPYATEPLARVVSALAGVVGRATNMFSAYYKYGVIFVNSDAGSISLLIDFECSGILEIMAFVALLVFFRAYTKRERIIVGITGVCYLILANALRIITICTVIYFFGMKSYYAAHTFVGRLLFYFLTVVLYFMVFTRTQIIRQKVGGFAYGNNK